MRSRRCNVAGARDRGRTVYLRGGGGLGTGGTVGAVVLVDCGGTAAALGQKADGATSSSHDAQRIAGRDVVKVPFGHALQVLARPVVFHGHNVHEAAPEKDTMPGGQLMQICDI
jgi:hypothetical protein